MADKLIEILDGKSQNLPLTGSEKLKAGRFFVTTDTPNEAIYYCPEDGKIIKIGANTEYKANLEYKEISTDIFSGAETGIQGKNIYILTNFYEMSFDGNFLRYIAIFGNGEIRLPLNETFSSIEKLNALGLIVGKRYEIDMGLDTNNEAFVLNSVKVLLDVEDKVDKTDIDQTFDPESSNAQSGKAVAEALNSIGGGGEDMYELIETIEVTEAEVIRRDNEPDGTPYNFKRVFIHVETTATDFALMRVFFRTSSNLEIITHDFSAFSNKTQAQRSWCEVYPNCGWWTARQISWTQYAGYQVIQEPAVQFKVSTEEVPTIQKIWTTTAATPNTTIKIWGVRA